MGPLSRFLRRRRVEVGVAFATLALVVLGIAFSLPEEHLAVARVGPDGTGYDEPVGRYLAEVNSSGLLRNLAGPQPDGIAALWVGEPEERLRPPGWKGLTQVRDDPTHNLEIEVRARGLDPEEALRVANGVAAEIVRLDGVAAATAAVAPIPSEATSGPSVAELQAALAKLRTQHPELVSDDGAAARLRSEEQTWERRRESERGLETRYTQELAHSEDLRQRVLDEARALWEAHKAELRDRARQAVLAQRKEPVQVEEPTGALAELEAELRRLLATLTLRHPEVRRLLRRIELERARLASLGTIPSDAPGALPSEEVLPGALPPEDGPTGGGPTEGGPTEGGAPPAEGEGAPSGPGAAPSEGSAPGTLPNSSPNDEKSAQPDAGVSGEVGLELQISDDEQPEGRALQHEQAVPAEWIQRAPSYREWISARDRAARTRAELESEQAQTQAMRLRLDRERRRLEERERSLVSLRGTEARLEDELSRARQLRPVPAPVRVGPRPRLQASAARTVSSFRPLDYLVHGLLLAALVALLFGWWVDRRDPAIHESEDLSDLRVPVLGVIPHLR